MADSLARDFREFFKHMGPVSFALLFLVPSSVWYTAGAQLLCFRWVDWEQRQEDRPERQEAKKIKK